MTRRQWMWLWIWLLLFFIIFCVWNKLLSYKQQAQATGTKPVLIEGTNDTQTSARPSKSKDILFKITKEGSRIRLSGVFPSEQALREAMDALKISGATVEKGTIIIDKNADNRTLRDALPAFARDLKKFSNGVIEYRKQKLTIKGTVRDASVKEDLERITATLGKAYTTENLVTVEKAPAPAPAPHKAKTAAQAPLHKEANQSKTAVVTPKAKPEKAKQPAPEAKPAVETAHKRAERQAAAEASARKQLDAILRGKRIEFLYASDEPTAKSKKILDQIAETLKKYPKVRIEIAGYTDSDGAAKRNLILSQRRARSVKNYLVKKGIEPSRLVAKGYGESHPLFKNDTPAHKQRNRRVEFHIIKEEK